MEISKQQIRKVLTTKCNFSQLGLNMMVTRLTGLYAKDPSESMLMKCTDEINAFFAKYQAIMGQDYETISKM